MSVSYPGGELELFRLATTWKSYYASHLRHAIAGHTLEVGAGIGGTSQWLCDGRQRSWTCLEPDPALLEQLRSHLLAAPLPVPCHVREGTLLDLDRGETFDTILYIDVLEHIADDGAEMRRASEHLRPGGRIVVLGPAHDWLFSPFDRAIGHYRRYSRRTLTRLTPPRLHIESLFYLDSVGMLASAANRAMLRADAPTPSQVWFWDSVLVRLSRLVDPLTGWRVGKSVVGIWTKPEHRSP